MKQPRAFTLVELIIVIAIIAILAAAIFVAIDPARRLHEARNARRSSDVATILDAAKKYQADHEGTHYSAIESLGLNTYYQIGTSLGACSMVCASVSTDGSCVNLGGMGTNYLAMVPTDPKDGSVATTKYAIMKDSNGALTVLACSAEGEGPGGNGTVPTIKIVR